MERRLHIFISCGERSGDEQAALLVAEIKKLLPNVYLTGQGGSCLEKAGVKIINSIEKTAGIMGFSAIIKHLPEIWKNFKRIRTHLVTEQPAVAIFVDYPDFNLRLAKAAKQNGIKTLYYIPPKLWAWRAGRIETFKKYIDHSAVIFPFEKSFFAEHGYPAVTFVGHPFSQSLKQCGEALAKQTARQEVCQKIGINPEDLLVALFPGSRRSEIDAHGEVLSDFIRQLKAKNSAIIILVAGTKSLDQFTAEKLRLAGAVISLDIDSIKILQAADCAVLKSGTSNLQAAYTNTPCCMFFKTNIFNQIIIRSLVSLKAYSPLNIILPNTITEYVQEEFKADNLVTEVMTLLREPHKKEKQLHSFAKIRSILQPLNGIASPAQHAAKIVEGLV